MNRNWNSREKGLQRLERILNFNSPWKRLILANQTSKRGHDRGIVCNESLIEISKPKETLNISNKSWGSPIHNSLNLTRVYGNAISKNNITQEFHLKLMESTLLQFGINTNLWELFQNKTYMVFMTCHVLWKNEDIINVINHKIIQILMKDITHHMSKNNRCIGKTKGHHNIFEMAITSIEHFFPFITFLNVHQVVCST